MKPGVYQFLVGCFAALGSFLFGYDLGVIAEVVASDSFKSLFLQKNADSRSGTVVALFTGGCFLGALGAGFSDRLGRRGTILMACCIFVVGGIIQTAGVVIAMLYVGRLIAGIGVGFLTMIIPIFQSEISHRKIRGRITSLQQLFNALGQIFATWISYGCYVTWTGTGNSKEWRIPLGCQIVPALFLGSLIYLFPESPRWLCDHDMADQGLRNLAKLHAHGDTHDPYVVAEYALIQSQIAEEHANARKTYFDLVRSWPQLRRTILTTMIQASCQMTGISAIQYFSPQIFQQIGIATSTTLLLSAVNAIIAFAGTSVCIAVIDSVGRRPLEIYGSGVMAMTYVINAILIARFPAGSSSNTGAHWGFIVMTWLFNFVFFITGGPLSWAIPAELFGTAMRTKGVSVGAMTSFAFNTMIGQVTPIAVTAIGWKYYIVFIVCNVTNGLFFWAFLPETKGLNLEDMDELFHESPTFVPGSKWKPSSHVEENAKDIAEQEKELGAGEDKIGRSPDLGMVERVEDLGLDENK
ncbi:MFS putative major facilitator superfamily transporter [Viridothelium virens]|uniref:MFS putative major facilitator superfamily transporter n=1 Tax=Viridothelium virens TaxID=1048519 RepID=A0A6A6GWB7_VIRVR|nr:MFS putative major facilitator superfamily transporter [Viridothelium virens]